jgi:hypothetical protein
MSQQNVETARRSSLTLYQAKQDALEAAGLSDEAMSRAAELIAIRRETNVRRCAGVARAREWQDNS